MSKLRRQDTKEIRRALHARSPNCYWCGRITSMEPARRGAAQSGDV